MAQQIISPESTKLLVAAMFDPKYRYDLHAWAKFVFPWGKPHTPLKNQDGPRAWQKEELDRYTEHIHQNFDRMRKGDEPLVYHRAVASGRGIGKSTLVSMLSLWNLTCNPGSTTILAANSENQLKSKTFAEISKWFTLCMPSYWFDKTTMKITPQSWFADQLSQHQKVDSTYYYVEGCLWAEDRPDSFTGVHNEKGLLTIFDEASGIPANIWDITEGCYTEPCPTHAFFAFGNPRHVPSAFHRCFNEHREFWSRRQINALQLNESGISTNTYHDIIKKYGKDSREARIEVYGEFPEQGDCQFISRSVVDGAASRTLDRSDDYAPLCMGVDPARFGNDSSVIRFRRGRDARSIPPIKVKNVDNMRFADICAHAITKFNPDAIAIDAGGGTGVIDRLRQMGYVVREVWFGEAPNSPEYADRRTELWDKMKEWLEHAMIDDDGDLKKDLSAPQYGFVGSGDKKKLESKDDMRKRGFASPDNGDALALTFAVNPASPGLKTGSKSPSRNRKAKGRDYRVLG